MATKTYTIRYFIPRVGADGKGGTVENILKKCAASPDALGPIREAGSQVHQIRIEKFDSVNSIHLGYFVRFRDELPRVGKRSTGEEKPPALEPDEEMIEKNHFVLFVDESGVEVIGYQMSMEGSDIAALPRYLSFASGEKLAISFDDVLTRDALELMQNGVLKSVEFEIAKPRSKFYAPDPNDTWTSEAMNYMSKSGATRFKAKLLTTSKTNGLVAGLKNQISLLLHSKLTKKLRVRVSDIDHPIDLFADRVFDKVTVSLVKGWPNSTEMFSEIVAAQKANMDLVPYLVKGDEALE